MKALRKIAEITKAPKKTQRRAEKSLKEAHQFVVIVV